MPRMLRRRMSAIGGAVMVAMLLAAPVEAVHESTNRLVFAPPASAAGSAAAGTGVVDYRGGNPEESRWTATFQFTGLDPVETYVVAVQGRYGDEGSPDALAFTPICSFRTDADGSGGCWYYIVVLKHLSVVQLYQGAVSGAAVLEATRAEGAGGITSEPNRFSPVDPGSPAIPADSTPQVATPASSPGAN